MVVTPFVHLLAVSLSLSLVFEPRSYYQESSKVFTDRLWRGRRCCETAPRPTFRKPPPPAVARCRCPFPTSSSGHAAARLSEPTRSLTPPVRELAGVSRLGIVKKNRNNSKTSPSTPHFNLAQRYPPYSTLTRVRKVNVWDMSSLLI